MVITAMGDIRPGNKSVLPFPFEATDTGSLKGEEPLLSHIDWGCLFLGLVIGPSLWVAAIKAEAGALDVPREPCGLPPWRMSLDAVMGTHGGISICQP